MLTPYNKDISLSRPVSDEPKHQKTELSRGIMCLRGHQLRKELREFEDTPLARMFKASLTTKGPYTLIGLMGGQGDGYAERRPKGLALGFDSNGFCWVHEGLVRDRISHHILWGRIMNEFVFANITIQDVMRTVANRVEQCARDQRRTLEIP